MRRSTPFRATSSTPTDQLAYDVFEYQTKDTLRGLQPDLLTLTEALPMNHFFGLHTEYPTHRQRAGRRAVRDRRRL